jgi:hypothetical protein
MTVTIDIPPELARKIMQAAAKAGLSPDAYIVESVTQRLQPIRHRQSKTPRLSREESDLLQKINQSLSQIEWTRYRELINKRQAEMLTKEEQLELIATSNQIEEANAKRLAYVAALARIRHMTLPALIKELGLKPLSYA